MAFVLSPQPPIDAWLEDFDSFAKRSPGFFAGRPVVVDIAAMPPSRPELVHMVTELKRRHITIMGLDGRAPGELGADARGLPPILSGGKEIASIAQLGAEALKMGQDSEEDAADDASAPDTAEADEAIAEAAVSAVEEAVDAPAGKTLILNEPVRSGQSVVHMKGDVTVIGSVASGAEVVASGSIHIYGALKGRAIAGSNGDRTARIFCSALNAELVAIDGLYKTNDDLDRAYVGQAVQAWLDGDALKMAAFNGKG
ncbi:MAG: septum site-determining protein MinC [Pseudomonadota bacterium]